MQKVLCFVLFVMIFPATPLFADKPVTTVMDFQLNSVSESDMKSIISFLSASLHDTGQYRVIDTAQRDTILEELAFSNSGCTDESCQLEIGKLLSAEYIVTGDIALVGGRYILSARMLKTETSETINTGKGIYGDLGEMIDHMPHFASQLAGLAEADTVPAGVLPPEEAADSRDIWKWSTLGAGAIASGIGGYLMYTAFNYKTSDVDPAYNIYMEADSATVDSSAADYYNGLWAAYDTAYSEFFGRLAVSSAVTGVGLISIGVSVYLFLTGEQEAEPESPENPDMAFLLLPGRNAVGLSFRIRL